MSRLAALNTRQAISGKFQETQNFDVIGNDSYIYMLFIKQLNLKHKTNEF